MARKVIEEYDATTRKIVEKNGGLYIVYDGEDPKTLEIEAIRIRINKDENDPREIVFAGYNGFTINIPVGEDTVIPKAIYDNVLIKGNLKERIQKI